MSNILWLSAFMTTMINEQRTVIHALEKAGIRDRVKVMVGDNLNFIKF